MFGSRRRILDVVAVALFLSIMVVLFWPSGGGSEDADPAPDEVSEEQETPTPEATPSEEVSPEETEVAACETGDSAQILASFVTHFNDGNTEELRDLLPDNGVREPSTATFPGMDRESLHSFRVHESGATSDPGLVMAYLEQRHEIDEVWQMQDYSITRLTNYADPGTPPLDRADVVIERAADNLPRHEIEGRAIIDCSAGKILVWEFETDNLELALPVTVDAFLDAVGPYGTAEMRDLRMVVSSELREDGGSLRQWEIRRIDANNAAGSYVMAFDVFTPDGEQIIDFVYDGTRWYMQQRGWHESGSITGPGVLPLEHTLVNREPTETASLIRDQLDEIPDGGTTMITGEFDVSDELQRAVSLIHGVDDVQGVIEVGVRDGNLDRTRYRVVDEGSDLSVVVTEIRWIHLRRSQQFEPGRFIRPDDFQPPDRHYQPPETLADRMTFQGAIDHDEGIGERYELAWNGETVELTVRPSRGASDQVTFGDTWSASWAVERSQVGNWTVSSAGPANAATFPHAAVWDTGSYRFELSIDPDTVNDPAAWDEGEVNAIAGALVTDDG